MEAMTCGLPTFATCHGGPAEIIEDGISGFHIDPYHPDHASVLLVEFYEKCKEDPSYWNKISEAGLQRIYERLVYLDSTNFFFTMFYFDLLWTWDILGIHGRFTLKG